MNKAARSILQRIGPDNNIDNQRNQILLWSRGGQSQLRQREAADEDKSTFEAIPEEMLTESEKRHAKHRRQQAQAGRFTPAADRLPIMSKEEREAHNKNRPKWQQTEFEGPIEKLIEKYKDLDEVRKHLTLGQSMKYDSQKTGEFWPKGQLNIRRREISLNHLFQPSQKDHTCKQSAGRHSGWHFTLCSLSSILIFYPAVTKTAENPEQKAVAPKPKLKESVHLHALRDQSRNWNLPEPHQSPRKK